MQLRPLPRTPKDPFRRSCGPGVALTSRGPRMLLSDGMKVVAIVQARVGSSRLPAKIFLDLVATDAIVPF